VPGVCHETASNLGSATKLFTPQALACAKHTQSTDLSTANGEIPGSAVIKPPTAVDNLSP